MRRASQQARANVQFSPDSPAVSDEMHPSEDGLSMTPPSNVGNDAGEGQSRRSSAAVTNRLFPDHHRGPSKKLLRSPRSSINQKVMPGQGGARKGVQQSPPEKAQGVAKAGAQQSLSDKASLRRARTSLQFTPQKGAVQPEGASARPLSNGSSSSSSKVQVEENVEPRQSGGISSVRVAAARASNLRAELVESDELQVGVAEVHPSIAQWGVVDETDEIEIDSPMNTIDKQAWRSLNESLPMTPACSNSEQGIPAQADFNEHMNDTQATLESQTREALEPECEADMRETQAKMREAQAKMREAKVMLETQKHEAEVKVLMTQQALEAQRQVLEAERLEIEAQQQEVQVVIEDQKREVEFQAELAQTAIEEESLARSANIQETALFRAELEGEVQEAALLRAQEARELGALRSELAAVNEARKLADLRASEAREVHNHRELGALRSELAAANEARKVADLRASEAREVHNHREFGALRSELAAANEARKVADLRASEAREVETLCMELAEANEARQFANLKASEAREVESLRVELAEVDAYAAASSAELAEVVAKRSDGYSDLHEDEPHVGSELPQKTVFVSADCSSGSPKYGMLPDETSWPELIGNSQMGQPSYVSNGPQTVGTINGSQQQEDSGYKKAPMSSQYQALSARLPRLEVAMVAEISAVADGMVAPDGLESPRVDLAHENAPAKKSSKALSSSRPWQNSSAESISYRNWDELPRQSHARSSSSSSCGDYTSSDSDVGGRNVEDVSPQSTGPPPPAPTPPSSRCDSMSPKGIPCAQESVLRRAIWIEEQLALLASRVCRPLRSPSPSCFDESESFSPGTSAPSVSSKCSPTGGRRSNDVTRSSVPNASRNALEASQSTMNILQSAPVVPQQEIMVRQCRDALVLTEVLGRILGRRTRERLEALESRLSRNSCCVPALAPKVWPAFEHWAKASIAERSQASTADVQSSKGADGLLRYLPLRGKAAGKGGGKAGGKGRGVNSHIQGVIPHIQDQQQHRPVSSVAAPLLKGAPAKKNSEALLSFSAVVMQVFSVAEQRQRLRCFFTWHELTRRSAFLDSVQSPEDMDLRLAIAAAQRAQAGADNAWHQTRGELPGHQALAPTIVQLQAEENPSSFFLEQGYSMYGHPSVTSMGVAPAKHVANGDSCPLLSIDEAQALVWERHKYPPQPLEPSTWGSNAYAQFFNSNGYPPSAYPPSVYAGPHVVGSHEEEGAWRPAARRGRSPQARRHTYGGAPAQLVLQRGTRPSVAVVRETLSSTLGRKSQSKSWVE